MDIKEIALRIGEEADDYADAKLQSKGEFHPDWHTVRDEYFTEALISAYKAELLKEVGEPVAYQVGNSYPRLDGTMAKIVGICNQTVFDDEGCHYYNRAQDRGRVTGTAHDYSYPRNLVRYYTSDQLAAAILKATKPLKEVGEALGEYISSADDSPAAVRRLVSAYNRRTEHLQAKVAELTAEVERLKEENDTLRRIHKESIDILVKALSDKDYEYNQKTNRLIERHAEQLNRCDAEVKRLTGRKDGEVPNY